MPETDWLGDGSVGGAESKTDWLGGADDLAAPAKKKGAMDWVGDVGSAYTSARSLDPGVGRVFGGLGRGIVDLISRGMYASAGAAEEAFSPEGGGPRAIGPRIAREALSGLPFTGIEGDKRDFIEVMERAGVPELGHLHDLIPSYPVTTPFGTRMLPTEGSVLDVSGRGVAGFAADVALDPTTWITSGGSTVGRFATAKGVLNLNKRGLAVKDAIVGELAPTYRLLAESSDDVLKETGRRQVRELLEARVREAVTKDPKLLEKTGLKFAGMEVISPSLAKKFTAPVRQMLESTQFGAKTATIAQSFEEGIHRAFDAYADIAKLDDTAREGVKNKVREFKNSLAASMQRDAQPWAEIQKEEARLARRYGKGDVGIQALGKKFADWRQRTGTPKLSTEEEAFFQKVAANIEARSQTNVRNGVITGEQYDKYKDVYLHQGYKNADEALVETIGRQAVVGEVMSAARVNKERQFDTFAEAVDISKRLEAEGKKARASGQTRQMYGELIPEYGISKGLYAHIQQSNRAIFQKKLFDDITENYGLKLDEFYDPSRVYAINEPIEIAALERNAIDEFIQGHRTLKELSESFDFTQRTARTPELRGAERRLAEVIKSAPVKFVDKQTLKNIDEFRYYKRRGWEIVEEPGGATKPESVLAPREVTDAGGTGRYVFHAVRANGTAADEIAKNGLKPGSFFAKTIREAEPFAGALHDPKRYFAVPVADIKSVKAAADDVFGQEFLEAGIYYKSGVAHKAIEVDRLGVPLKSSASTPSRYVAYKVNDVGTAEYTSWASKVKKARAEIDAASVRAGRDVRVSHEGWDNLAKEAKKVLPTLSPDAKKELARQLTSMSRDESHILKVVDAVGEANMPRLQTLKPGDTNPFFLKHGLPEEKARLVTRGGGIWGDQEHLIPQAIADLLDDADRDLLKSKDWQKNMSAVVKGWDFVGNLFKGITYPAYISGAFRDLYNNLEHTFLALGIGGLTRPDLAARVRAGGEGLIEMGGRTHTAAQWKKMSEALRVVDPSASSFVQTTGKEGAEKATRYAKARALRGQVDNGTRTQLWTSGIRMGMTPEDAARMVHEFHYNYAELSPFDRDVMRRLMPFYVFPRKTIELYPKVALKTPGRLANLHKPFMGRDSENQEMTTWEGEGYKLRLDKNGRDITVLNGIDMPVRSFDMLYSGRGIESLIGSAHPIPKVFYMLTSGRDPFRGKEMNRMQVFGPWLDKMPTPIKNFFNVRSKTDAAGRTTYTANEAKVRDTLELLMLSRVFSTSERYFREEVQDPGAPSFWLSFLTGLQAKTLNLDDEQKKKLAMAERIANEEAVKQGDAYQKTYRIPKRANQ